MKELIIHNKKLDKTRTILTYEPCIETMLMLGYRVSCNYENGVIKLENDSFTIIWNI